MLLKPPSIHLKPPSIHPKAPSIHPRRLSILLRRTEYPPKAPEYPPKTTEYPPKTTEYPPKTTEYHPNAPQYPSKPGYQPKPPYDQSKPYDGKAPEPKYGDPKYGEPKYGEPKYGEPKYGEPKYGEPKYGEPKYGDPKYGAPKYGEPKYGGPVYGHEIPEPRCGKTQCRLDPIEVKRCVEQTCFEITKCHKPPCLPLGKCPVTKVYKPEYCDTPECIRILDKLRPDYDDPTQHIFERRINESLHVWPHCAIGKIWVGANHNYQCPLWTGTGVLVGKDLMLTASHTIPWNRDGWWMRFVPAYSEGSEPFGSSYIMDVRGYEATGTSADDFAICKLYTPLGDTCGWMGTEGWTIDSHYTSASWNRAGYSHLFKNGEVQFWEDEQKIKKIKDDGCFKLLETKGDPWGWSGGVLWGWSGDDAVVIGALSGSEHLLIFTSVGWAGGPGMVDLVNWAWTHWE